MSYGGQEEEEGIKGEEEEKTSDIEMEFEYSVSSNDNFCMMKNNFSQSNEEQETMYTCPPTPPYNSEDEEGEEDETEEIFEWITYLTNVSGNLEFNEKDSFEKIMKKILSVESREKKYLLTNIFQRIIKILDN